VSTSLAKQIWVELSFEEEIFGRGKFNSSKARPFHTYARLKGIFDV
jgi:hypothetical protein